MAKAALDSLISMRGWIPASFEASMKMHFVLRNAWLIGVILTMSSCRHTNPPSKSVNAGNPYEGLAVVATISDQNAGELKNLVTRLLEAKGIRVVIEGSLVYPVMVSKDETQKAIETLSEAPALRGRGIRIGRNALTEQ